MTVWVYRPGHPDSNQNGMVDRALVEPESGGIGFYVISDTMAPLRHMATGKMHDSKAAFRADTKASNCIEYGSDPSLGKPRKPVPLSREKRRDDIRKTIYDIRNGKHG